MSSTERRSKYTSTATVIAAMHGRLAALRPDNSQ